jgi:ABC-type uncharacterized transport system auxiliary subunit
MTMNPKYLTAGLIGALAVLSMQTGCVTLKKKYPEKRYFVLDVTRPDDPAPPAAGTVLTVHRFQVSPLYESKSFVYRRKGLNYESDFYNEFLISPGSLVTEQTRRWLKNSGLFDHVVDPAARIVPTHVLQGSVATLLGDNSNPEEPKAVLELQFFLLGEAKSSSHVVMHRSYRKSIPVVKTTPEDFVHGWNTALERILTEFESDLKAGGLSQAK